MKTHFVELEKEIWSRFQELVLAEKEQIAHLGLPDLDNIPLNVLAWRLITVAADTRSLQQPGGSGLRVWDMVRELVVAGELDRLKINERVAEEPSAEEPRNAEPTREGWFCMSAGELIAELQKYPADAIVLGKAEPGASSRQTLTRVMPADYRVAQPGEECSWIEAYRPQSASDANVVWLGFEAHPVSIRFYLNRLEPETEEQIARRE